MHSSMYISDVIVLHVCISLKQRESSHFAAHKFCVAGNQKVTSINGRAIEQFVLPRPEVAAAQSVSTLICENKSQCRVLRGYG